MILALLGLLSAGITGGGGGGSGSGSFSSGGGSFIIDSPVVQEETSILGEEVIGGTDYGDAPAPYTQASHFYESWEWLGTEKVMDDGVFWSGPFIPGEVANITFKASTSRHPQSWSYVNIWADWDQSGSWESVEQIVSWYGGIPKGVNTIIENFDFIVPSSAVAGTTWLRARLAKENIGPVGETQYGECEDYPINVVPEPATLLLLSSGLFGLAAFGRAKKRKRV